MLDRARAWLDELGLPSSDIPTLPSSERTFADGGLYKWEVAGPVDAANAERLIEGLRLCGVHLNQITHTSGIMRMRDHEIEDLVGAVEASGRQLVLAVGPRGTYDIGAQKLAPGTAAHASTFRLRGMEQVVRGLDDVLRGVELGARGFLVFDEGLLWLLSQLRARGDLPRNMRLKASSALGVANAVHCRIIAELGANSINLQRDLELGMVASARRATSVPFDLHVDNPTSTGGFVRTYECPELVRVGAPVYLKAGNSVMELDDLHLTRRQAHAIVREIAVQAEALARLSPDQKPSLSVDD